MFFLYLISRVIIPSQEIIGGTYPANINDTICYNQQQQEKGIKML